MMIEEKEEIRSSWDNIGAGYNEFVTPTHFWLANEALRRAHLRPGMKFLDVAAGSGALSIPAARLGAEVTSVDISSVMLQHLKSRAATEMLKVKTCIMDGHSLELGDNTFDMAGSQFGVMLFPDMPRGIREMARVIRPNGTVVIIAYGNPHEIEFFGCFIQGIRAAVPEFTGPSMDPPPLPFQLQDPAKLHQRMSEAGLKDVGVETITETLNFQSGKHLWDWLVNSNPIVGHVLGDLSLTTEQTTVVQNELEREIRTRAGASPIAALTNPINIGIGRK